MNIILKQDFFIVNILVHLFFINPPNMLYICTYIVFFCLECPSFLAITWKSFYVLFFVVQGQVYFTTK